MMQIISSAQSKTLMAQGAQLIDVRTEVEFQQGAASGAKNLPIQRLKIGVDDLDDQKPVIVYCHTGGRSAVAQQILQSFGFLQVHNAGTIHNF